SRRLTLRLLDYSRWPSAAIRHVHEVDAGHHLKQLAEYMASTPNAGRRHIDLARIGFRVGDELGNCFGRNRRMYHHDEGVAADGCARGDVADEIETELVVGLRVDGVRRASQEQRVAVRRRLPPRLGAHIAGSTRPVLDDEWLAEPLRQPLADQARVD